MYILYTTTIKGFRFISAEILGSVKNQGKLRYSFPDNSVPAGKSPVYRGRFTCLWAIDREQTGSAHSSLEGQFH